MDEWVCGALVFYYVYPVGSVPGISIVLWHSSISQNNPKENPLFVF